MSGQLRALKTRIRGIENTQKITRAMEMVAASKLKRFQNLYEQTIPYVQTLENVLGRLLKSETKLPHPLTEKREQKTIAVLVITSDTGLCGSYNQGLISAAEKFIVGQKSKNPLLLSVGKNGTSAFSRIGLKSHKTWVDTKTSRLEAVIEEVTEIVQQLFLSNKVDSVYAVYSHFASRSSFNPTTEQILPFELKADLKLKETHSGDTYIMEPSPESLFSRLVPLVFGAKLRSIFMESFISEQMARMNAMSQAAKNAFDLINILVLLRNKMRQAAITNELIEIVSGSRALKS